MLLYPVTACISHMAQISSGVSCSAIRIYLYHNKEPPEKIAFGIFGLVSGISGKTGKHYFANIIFSLPNSFVSTHASRIAYARLHAMVTIICSGAYEKEKIPYMHCTLL